jgi:putative ABC transport system permease protein
VLRIPLLAGRSFQPTDDAAGEPVAIVSRAFAEAMFGNENPVGRSFEDGSESVTIVGVAEDLRTTGFDQARRPAVYRASAQQPSELICLVVRASAGTAGLGDALRQAVHGVDPDIPAMHVTTIDRILSDSVSDRRFYTTTTTTFAGLALVLTAAGLVVVVSRSVTERRREMAIRAALGAESGRLVRLVAAQGLTPVVAGATVGLAGAALGGRLIQPFLFGISPRDPGVFIACATGVLLVAGLACVLPARRLATLAPAPILRGE